jgi:tight adherence protein C
MPVFIVLLAMFITLYIIFYFLLVKFFSKKQVISSRLQKVTKDSQKTREDELGKSLYVRVIKPFLEDVSKTILRITPKEIVSALERKVVRAGSPMNITVRGWINIQAMILLLLPAFTLMLCIYLGINLKTVFLVILIEIFLGLTLPNIVLGRSISNRQRCITNSLPDVLDLLTVSVEAGLGFDGALAKVIDKMPGPIAIEFGKVLQEMKVGKPKRDALKDMSDRVGVNDLNTFISSIIQAEQFGVSIGNVLRIQSEQMRQKRRQRAQEKAMKAPIKMLIPMVLFIFPTLFSVLLGPVVIKVIKIFVK